MNNTGCEYCKSSKSIPATDGFVGTGVARFNPNTLQIEGQDFRVTVPGNTIFFENFIYCPKCGEKLI